MQEYYLNLNINLTFFHYLTYQLVMTEDRDLNINVPKPINYSRHTI